MKLTLKNTILLSIWVAITGFFLASLILSQETKTAFGSVSQGSDYQSLTATSGLASASVSVALTAQTLASITITGSSTGNVAPFRVWDATSTATSTYQNENKLSTTTTYGRQVAILVAGIQPQTYTFDTNLFKGAVVEVPVGFNGVYTITYR